MTILPLYRYCYKYGFPLRGAEWLDITRFALTESGDETAVSIAEWWGGMEENKFTSVSLIYFLLFLFLVPILLLVLNMLLDFQMDFYIKE